jgi:hypothetical protein
MLRKISQGHGLGLVLWNDVSNEKLEIGWIDLAEYIETWRAVVIKALKLRVL